MADKSKELTKELLDLEKTYWKAMQERDAETCMRLSDDTTFVTGAQGVGKLDRKSLGAMMKAPPYSLDSFAIKDAEVRQISDDVAIVIYKVHEDLTVDGKKVSLDAADSSTWVRRNGSWVCALHTEALAGDPFGRDRRPVS